MRLGIIVLIAAYGLSQFYRAFLAVLAPALEADIGATREALSAASGIWFLVFAAMQIPVGEALDRIGPKLTTTVLFALCGAGGAAVFAMATEPWHISLAMGLIGAGCAPVLMASYYIFARVFSAAVFASLAGMTLGIGSLGNILSSAPTAWAVDIFGWRATLWAMAGFKLLVAIFVFLTVKDPEKVTSEKRGSVIDVLKIPALWPVFAMVAVNYVPAASLRGLWSGQYLSNVFGADAALIGNVTLVMGLAMIFGNLSYGPVDRMVGSRKWVVWVGNAICLFALLALAVAPNKGIGYATIMLAIIGFFGASFPLIMAHGRSFIPPHLVGRGVTLLNLFSLGTVGVVQFTAAPLSKVIFTDGRSLTDSYAIIFAGYAVLLGAGLLIYLFAKDSTE